MVQRLFWDRLTSTKHLLMSLLTLASAELETQKNIFNLLMETYKKPIILKYSLRHRTVDG